MADNKENKGVRKRRPRRFNGTGCVYKQSGRRAKPWVARVIAGFDEDGKYIYQYTFHETSTDASNAISDMQKNCNLNPQSEDTVHQIWERFKSVRYPKLSESTKNGYDASYAHWNDLHDRKIAELKTNDLQDIINQKHDMSYSHLSKMRALMVAIFNVASKDDIVKRNYASLIELPKGEPETARRAFTDAELEKIRVAASNTDDKVPYADVILFMCYTGWRPTEMCKLTPNSVDTDNWLITGGIKTETGKDSKSIRPIVTSWLSKGYNTLFADEQGKPLNKDKWRVRFANAMTKIFGELTVVPYTTRHTCASILHAAGADHLSIAKILGHKDYKITANVYTHVDLAELKVAVETLS